MKMKAEAQLTLKAGDPLALRNFSWRPNCSGFIIWEELFVVECSLLASLVQWRRTSPWLSWLHFELNGLLYRYSVRPDSLIVLQYYTYLGRLVLMHCSGVKYQRKSISLSHLPCRKTKKQIFKLFFLTGTLSCGNRITHCILVLVDIHFSESHVLVLFH